MSIHVDVESPTKFVVRTSSGRKLKSFRKISSALDFAAYYVEKKGGSKKVIVNGKLRYVPPAKTKARTKARTKKPVRRRVKKKGRRR